MQVRSDVDEKKKETHTGQKSDSGRYDRFVPSSLQSSILGMSKDHTDAATITPEANPNRAFCTIVGIDFLNKKTQAAPAVVPAKGNKSPISNPSVIGNCLKR